MKSSMFVNLAPLSVQIIMNHMIRNLFLLISGFSRIFSTDDLCNNKLSINTGDVSEEYIPLRYSIIKSFVITNPCDTDKSILIQQNFVYKFDREQLQWKRLCVSRTLFTNQVFMSYKSNAHPKRISFRFQSLIQSLI
jgi:hypothetical protein